MDKKIEIISFVDRRRRWSDDEKLSILAEAFEPGATVAVVADRNGVSRSLLYNWLRQAREGQMPGVSVDRADPTPEPSFVPVRVEDGAAIDPAPPPLTLLKAARPDREPTQMIEIVLRNGRVILHVTDKIKPDRLAGIVAALAGPDKP